MADLEPDRFIFLDMKGKRWPRLRILILLTGFLVFIGLIFFFQSLFVTSQLQLPTAISQMKARLKALQQQDEHVSPRQAKPQWLEYSKKQSSGAHSAAPVSAHQKGHPVREIRLGFHVGWYPGSYEALNAYADKLTHVCPEWMTLADGEGNLDVKPDEKAAKLAEAKRLILMPLLSNLADDGRFPEAVEGLANGPESRKEGVIAAVFSQLKKAGAGGMVIDWGALDPAYRDAVTTLLPDCINEAGLFRGENNES